MCSSAPVAFAARIKTPLFSIPFGNYPSLIHVHSLLISLAFFMTSICVFPALFTHDPPHTLCLSIHSVLYPSLSVHPPSWTFRVTCPVRFGCSATDYSSLYICVFRLIYSVPDARQVRNPPNLIMGATKSNTLASAPHRSPKNHVPIHHQHGGHMMVTHRQCLYFRTTGFVGTVAPNQWTTVPTADNCVKPVNHIRGLMLMGQSVPTVG
jgi:hypothetical protein